MKKPKRKVLTTAKLIGLAETAAKYDFMNVEHIRSPFPPECTHMLAALFEHEPAIPPTVAERMDRAASPRHYRC